MRAVIFAIIGIYAYLGMALWSPIPKSPICRKKPCALCDTPEKGYQCQPATSHNWGSYAPYFTVPSKISAKVPSGCLITFAQVLSRHGARFPTKRKTAFYKETIDVLRKTAKKYPAKYAFLKTFRLRLGHADLTYFGEQQMINSGIKFYNQYSSLAKLEDPFFRAAGSDRVIESGMNFTQGYHMAKSKKRPDNAFPYPMLVISEADGQNNTLQHITCTNFENGPKYGAIESKKWAAQFVPPIAKRINTDLGTNLNLEQVHALMDLCPFETVDDPQGKFSPFCNLFTQAEWVSFSYYYTLTKFYNIGAGNPLGPTQGVGWTNELIARLTNTPVQDHTTTNSTLTSNPATFPLHKKLYADFTHDNSLTAIMFAMGLYETGRPLLKDKTQSRFSASVSAPFAARMYVEKMRCKGKKPSDELVRVLVNDRVVPLRNCGADQLGRCSLGNFVESLGFAQRGGDWDKCFSTKSK
ncbi:hypothetical protein ANO11243_064580 [Dothideomycetidae sp. 11243]|nr:hypothetical protein ANO11243_064580 [fungal sp. No.11243]